MPAMYVGSGFLMGSGLISLSSGGAREWAFAVIAGIVVLLISSVMEYNG